MATNKITKIRGNVVLKAPGETITEPVDLTQRLPSGVTLSSLASQAVVDDSTELAPVPPVAALTVVVGTVSGTSVNITVSGGSDGTTYGIVLLFNASNGDVVEAYCPLQVASR